ncbi:MAG: hypothetical protein FWC72_04515 [Oscillospiraceae bacterium]|nr:hypothetical protein [Oscillospiraceae bacterium]
MLKRNFQLGMPAGGLPFCLASPKKEAKKIPRGLCPLGIFFEEGFGLQTLDWAWICYFKR